MEYITEPERRIPVAAEAELCVIGGSCTGVFAAVKAARAGLSVIIVERQNRLGGTAVGGLVNIWHTLMDMNDRDRIIAGLTSETLERLDRKGALDVSSARNDTYNFNPSELAVILDEYIRENRIKLFLHTLYTSVVREGDGVSSIIIENKDGRQAIKAGFFIDASGDGDVARDLGLPCYTCKYIQPPSSCFHLQGDTSGLDLRGLIKEHGPEFGLPDDWGWYTHVAGCDGLSMRADNHVFGLRCDRAAELTEAELEGRRQADAFVSMLNRYAKKPDAVSGRGYSLVGLCSQIGIRETVHYASRFKATGRALLTGERYDAPVMNGTYPIDIHHSDDMGISFLYLDGSEKTVYGKDTRTEYGSWRERYGYTGDSAAYYQVPFDILVNDDFRNFMTAGRMLNAEMDAYGALRVMVNLNQLGEAAGVAAALCIGGNADVRELDGKKVTAALRSTGSAL